MTLRLFDQLCLETQSTCNRACLTCLRQTYPDRPAVAGCFQPRRLPPSTVYGLLDQAVDLGFYGAVCLSFYNEPLLDPRLSEFAAYAHDLHAFAEVFVCTNGDALTPEIAQQLDGKLDHIRVALYDGSAQEGTLRSLFRHTTVTFTGGSHIPRHYTCEPATVAAVRRQPCERESQQRCLIAADGTLRLCCEDIAGVWDLGNVYTRSLGDLWFGEPHAGLVERLQAAGGRAGYCATCPQHNQPYWSAGRQMLTAEEVA